MNWNNFAKDNKLVRVQELAGTTMKFHKAVRLGTIVGGD